MKRLPLVISILLLLCSYANAQSKGVVKDGVYSNAAFGFTFTYPKDWVVHGEATDERIREIGKERLADSGTPKASVEVAVNNTYQLLTVFRHPVGTPGVKFNPGILVIAENIAYAPGITNGKDYLLNVRTILTKLGHQALLKDPVEQSFAGVQFYRDNFAVELNGVHMVQAHFATVKNGFALAFVFLGEDEKSLDEMTKTMETFTSTPVREIITIIEEPPPPKPKPKP